MTNNACLDDRIIEGTLGTDGLGGGGGSDDDDEETRPRPVTQRVSE